MDGWRELYEKERTDLENALQEKSLEKSRLIHEIKNKRKKLEEIQDKLSTFRFLFGLERATHFIRKDDFYIITPNNFVDEIFHIELKYPFSIITISYIPCISEVDAKAQLTQYIQDQIKNEIIYKSKTTLLSALNAIKAYDLKIDTTYLNELNSRIFKIYEEELDDIRSNYIMRLRNLKKDAVEMFINMISPICQEPINTFLDNIDVLKSNSIPDLESKQ